MNTVSGIHRKRNALVEDSVPTPRELVTRFLAASSSGRLRSQGLSIAVTNRAVRHRVVVPARAQRQG